MYLRVYCVILLSLTGCGSSAHQTDSELLAAVAISRHGIRSPTASVASMNLYTLRPQGFPNWPPPADLPGNLSSVGRDNALRLGAWYRDYYAAQGLLPPRGSCPETGAVFVYADVFERTLTTAQGYLDGMFRGEATPGCGIPVVHSSEPLDPYITTAAAGVCLIDTAMDLAAFTAQTGETPAALLSTYADQLQTLQTVTQCCAPAATAPPLNPCTLRDLPTTVKTTGSVRFASGTLFDVADKVTETFDLEYAQGMPATECSQLAGAECVGWGAIPPGGLEDLLRLHVLNIDLSCRLPSFAQVGASNLMWQLRGTMEQALNGSKEAEILAPTESRFVMFVAHDENLSAIAGFLGGVTWKAEGFPRNDPGPTGALLFELHRLQPSGQLMVRLFYVIPTLEQMRRGTTLTLTTPPQRLPLVIPACGDRLDCPYEQFKSIITARVRRDCLVHPLAAGQ